MAQPSHASGKQPAAGRLQALDVLRGVAILLVLGRHLGYVDQMPPSVITPFYRCWQHMGWAGVDLFFVLSGFLVSGLLFREHLRHGRLDLVRFYIRRGLKIYPGFYVLMGLTVLALLGAQYSGLLLRFAGKDAVPASVWWRVFHDAIYVQNYWLGLWPHTWSLAVEEHFYLLLGLSFLPVLARRRKSAEDPFRPLLTGIPLVALVVLGLRLATAAGGQVSFARMGMPTHLRLDSLLWGVWLSYFHHYHQAALARFVEGRQPVLVLAAAALVSPAFLCDLETSAFLLTYGFTLIALGCMILVALAVLQTRGCCGGRLARVTEPVAQVVAAIGFYSYSIYLYHSGVGWAMYLATERFLPGARSMGFILVWQACFVAVTIGLGILMARLVEVPTLVLRDKLFPSRAGGLAAASSDGS